MELRDAAKTAQHLNVISPKCRNILYRAIDQRGSYAFSCSPILHRFGDTVGALKVENRQFIHNYTPHSHLAPSLKAIPFKFRNELRVSAKKLKYSGSPPVKKSSR